MEERRRRSALDGPCSRIINAKCFTFRPDTHYGMSSTGQCCNQRKRQQHTDQQKKLECTNRQCFLISLTQNSDQPHQRKKCQNNTQQNKNRVNAVWNDVDTEYDKPCTHTLKGVNRHTRKRILVVPDQTRRMDDNLETNCATRQGADATPSTKQRRSWLENMQK